MSCGSQMCCLTQLLAKPQSLSKDLEFREEGKEGREMRILIFAYGSLSFEFKEHPSPRV